MDLQCVFLNLDAAPDRRAAIEASFAAAAGGAVELQRFPAVGAVEAGAIPGTLSAAQKGCFASHRAVLSAHLDDPRPLFVMEDDTAFSAKFTFPVLLSLLGAPEDWDILFTDIGLWEPSDLVTLTRMVRELRRDGQFQLLDLTRRQCFGSNAYVVRGSAKAKLSAALDRAVELDVPYDLYLRQLIAAGEIRARACLPFLTTLSAHSEASQINDPSRQFFDRTVNVFRRMMFVDRDPGASLAQAGALFSECSDDAKTIGALCAAVASDKFQIGV